MTPDNEERRPGTGGVHDQPGSKIAPIVPRPSVVLGLDHDGVVLLTLTAIVAIAGRAIERGYDAHDALVEVLDLARKMETIWLAEQLSEVAR